MANADLTPEEARAILDYDAGTGVFRWKINKKRVRAGDVAGGICKPLGYVQVVIGQRHYYGHRLAWFYVHGKWPEGQIDHINGERADNRLGNLREVSIRINRQNLRRARKDNVSGFLGVHEDKRNGRWRASLKTPDKDLYLGSYDTPEQAHEAYLAAKRKYHEGCTL